VGASGVIGSSQSGTNAGVKGMNSSGGDGVLGTSGTGTGVKGVSISGYGVRGRSSSTAIAGVLGDNYSGGDGVEGYSSVGNGVYGSTGGLSNSGVKGENTAGGYGVWGITTGTGLGVYGSTTNGSGVFGRSTSNGTGVAGESLTGAGGIFTSTSGYSLITNVGNVGIGTFSPAEKLTINNGRILFTTSVASSALADRISSTAPANFEVGGNWTPSVNNVHNVGSSTKRWANIYAVNGTINTSDRREKQNIQTLNYGLKELMLLKPVTFEWKNAEVQGTKIGFIAQDLQNVIKEVVVDKVWSKDEEGKMISKPADVLGVYYSDLIPVLTKAIQEQQAIIDTQNQKIDALVKRIEILEKK
jgi:Chaperone of endosialidase